MLDSDAMKQIQKTIEILNNLNDINSKLEPFKMMDQSKRSPKRKQLSGWKKQKYSWINLLESLHALYVDLTIPKTLKKMEKILKVIKDIYVNLAKKLLIPLLTV